MPKITFSHSGKSIEAEHDEWLYDVSDRADGGIPFSCKAGACGTCATEVLEGSENLGSPSAREIRTLESKQLNAGTYRLPCLCDVHGDVVFGKPHSAVEAESKLGVHQVQVEAYRPLNATVAEARFFVEDPGFEFKPGQYMIFHIPHPSQVLRRSYSISTPPSDSRHFEVCVRSVAGGHGSNYIHRLRTGNALKVEGPFGDFVLEEGSRKNILMVATGTGMSPIKSMLMHLLDIKSRRRIRLFFGVRHESDIFYTDLFRGLASRYPEFEYEIVLSSPNPDRWVGHKGRVTDLVERFVQASDAEDTEAYLCGGQQMIGDVSDLLKHKGFPADAIHHENFY